MWRLITATIASLALPAIAVAQQGDAGTQSGSGMQDSTSTQGTGTSDMSKTTGTDSGTHHRRHHRSHSGMGTQGVRGASASAVEIMALQQELRDRGCSPGSVTGHVNAQTRHAMACARDKNIGTGDTPMAMLRSLNIGFSGDDTTQTFAFITGTEPSPGIGGGAVGGSNMSGAGLGGSMGTPSNTTNGMSNTTTPTDTTGGMNGAPGTTNPGGTTGGTPVPPTSGTPTTTPVPPTPVPTTPTTPAPTPTP
ncbi:MAG TPA: hypothetical protein VNU46_01880 [Gemmatimonadaceae bacterium]|jgi:hypothetical protein|nr:hypothetical protein [Gemmatimonadaceae bacterium]